MRQARWVQKFSIGDDGWIKLFPKGTRKRGKSTITLTDPVLQQMQDNFSAGRPQYKPPINIEHKDELGRQGVIAGIEYRDDGAYFKPDESGDEFLRQGKFGYISPEVIWKGWQDPITGTYYDNVVVGVAATNYPYFGEDVALFSDSMPDAENFAYNSPFGLLYLMQDICDAIEMEGDNTDDPSFKLALQTAEEAVKGRLNQVVNDYRQEEHPELVVEDSGLSINKEGHLYTMIYSIINKIFGSKQLSTEEVVEEVPMAGSTVVQGQVLTAAVPENYSDEIVRMRADLDAERTKRETVEARLAATERRARLSEFRHVVDQFSNLTAPSDNFAETLLDWSEALGEERFNALTVWLSAIDKQLKNSKLFSKAGSDDGQTVEDPEDAADAAIKKYMADNPGVNYADASKEVIQQHPELYVVSE